MSGVFAALYLYFRGLRYTLLLNVMGLLFFRRAWNGNLLLFGGATYAPAWLFVAVGLILQLPGLFYLGLGAWLVCDSPGVTC